MKIDIDIPGGGKVHLERLPKEPMPLEKFHSIVNLIGGYGVGIAVLLLAQILTSCG